MILLFPASIKFKNKEDRDKFAPASHIFYGQRCVDVPDGLPKWEEMDEKSNLIADSPEEAIKKRKRDEAEEKEKEKNGDNEGDEGQKEKKTAKVDGGDRYHLR